MTKRIKSVFQGTDRELLPILFKFFCDKPQQVRDVTANSRKMWKGVSIPGNILFYDIDPSVEPDVLCAWDNLPDEDETVDVVVFDPPHLPKAAASPKSDQKFSTNYGLSMGGDADNISGIFDSFLEEAKRVLRPDGLIFAKVKDYVHNHRYQWVSKDFIQAVQSVSGLTPCDCIIKQDPSAGNMTSGRWKKQHHVRNSHCFWFIVRKGGCERKS